MTREEQIRKAADDYCGDDTREQSPCFYAHIHNAFLEGVAWADSHPHWIPVEERLPKRMNEKSRFSETVLVYNKEGYKDAAYYDYEEKIWRWMPMVTHWMEIVSPRKEANNER